MDLQEMSRVRNGMILLWMETCVRLLWKPYWIIGLHEMCGVASLTEVLFVGQEEFCFVELVIILSKLTEGFTWLTWTGNDKLEPYFIKGAGLGSLNRFPPDCELLPWPVGCAICWTFREPTWILVTPFGKTGNFKFYFHAEVLYISVFARVNVVV
jgi:hypothetical protein